MARVLLLAEEPHLNYAREIGTGLRKEGHRVKVMRFPPKFDSIHYANLLKQKINELRSRRGRRTKMLEGERGEGEKIPGDINETAARILEEASKMPENQREKKIGELVRETLREGQEVVETENKKFLERVKRLVEKGALGVKLSRSPYHFKGKLTSAETPVTRVTSHEISRMISGAWFGKENQHLGVLLYRAPKEPFLLQAEVPVYISSSLVTDQGKSFEGRIPESAKNIMEIEMGAGSAKEARALPPPERPKETKVPGLERKVVEIISGEAEEHGQDARVYQEALKHFKEGVVSTDYISLEHLEDAGRDRTSHAVHVPLPLAYLKEKVSGHDVRVKKGVPYFVKKDAVRITKKGGIDGGGYPVETGRYDPEKKQFKGKANRLHYLEVNGVPVAAFEKFPTGVIQSLTLYPGKMKEAGIGFEALKKMITVVPLDERSKLIQEKNGFKKVYGVSEDEWWRRSQ